MSDGNLSGNRDFELLKLNSSVARFRRKAERAMKEIEEKDARLAEAEELLGKFSQAYKAIKEDPRLQVPMEQFQELQSLSQQRTWQSHEEKFADALASLTANGVSTANGVTAKQILRAVGYDPSLVEDLTPEIIQDVIQTAYAEFPQLFSVATEPPSDQAEPQDQSIPGQFQQEFAAATQRPNAGPQVPQPPMTNGTPSAQPQMQPPNQFQQALAAIPGLQQAPAPQIRFPGYGGDFQGRGGPAPTKTSVVAARLRDPAWLAQNQGAVARAVAEGAQIIDSPD